MNNLYVKAILYSYPHLDELADQITELMARKAVASMHDFSPCERQCYKMVELALQKGVVTELKRVSDAVLKNFSEEDIAYLDKKYFRTGNKNSCDIKQGKEFFRQIYKLEKKIGFLFECEGVRDEWFKDNCMEIAFFRELVKTVKEREEILKKGKYTFERNKRTEKTRSVSA
ncbi:MAG: hypothetical protein SPJ19_02870 [Candidatus Borkfalkiaceae bacterium]|nr:hypothetical protein [Christensenellaceae bacterium]